MKKKHIVFVKKIQLNQSCTEINKYRKGLDWIIVYYCMLHDVHVHVAMRFPPFFLYFSFIIHAPLLFSLFLSLSIFTILFFFCHSLYLVSMYLKVIQYKVLGNFENWVESDSLQF